MDSPCLKLKPLSNRIGSGFRLVGVETYGGGLWHTWFDRDLGVAGRAFVRTSPTTIESRLIQIDEPLLRVPSLASHYEHQNPFKFSTEHHLQPVAGQTSQENFAEKNVPEGSEPIPGSFRYVITPAVNRHSELLVQKIASKLNTHPNNIIDFDLSLYGKTRSADNTRYVHFLPCSLTGSDNI